MRFLSAFLVLFIVSVTWAQTNVIKGKIFNAENNEAVEFANVGIENTYLGTASNAKGEFILEIAPRFAEYTVNVSAVGFKTKKILLLEWLNQKEIAIHLTPVNYGLSAVDVKADSKIAYGIIRTAVNLISDNYPQVAFTCEYLYTDQAKGESRTVTINDDTGYVKRSFADAFLSRNYAFEEDVKEDYILLKDGLTKMDQLLSGDIVRMTGNVLSVASINDFDISIKEETTLGSDSVYVIHYKCLNPTIANTGCAGVEGYEGDITISKINHAVLQNKVKVMQKGYSIHGNRFMTLVENDQKNSFTLLSEYKKQGNKYLLNLVQYTDSTGDYKLQLSKKLDQNINLKTHQYFAGKSH